MIGRQGSPRIEPQSPLDGSMRKRVCKACDRCRLKKSKCDGSSVCSRCRADNAICVFGERKKTHDKVYPKGYVEMLEQQQAQLVAGLQELYQRTQNGKGWEGAPLKESSRGTPLTHDILERLGSLKSGRHNLETEHFEEDVNSLQRRLLANGAGLMQRAPSDSGSDSGVSPASDRVSHKPPFTDAFTFGRLPPTPPTQSPYPQNISPEFPFNTQNGTHPSSMQKAPDSSLLTGQMWATTHVALDDNNNNNNNINLLDQYDSPISLNAVSNPFEAPQMPVGTIAPYLSMRDWNHDIDFQRYFSAATM